MTENINLTDALKKYFGFDTFKGNQEAIIRNLLDVYKRQNEEISRMVDTNDEWIMTRIGVKERRILNEEGLGTSYICLLYTSRCV